MSNSFINLQKKKYFTDALNTNSGPVLVLFSTKHSSVTIPEHLRNGMLCVIKFSKGFANCLNYDSTGIKQTLTFGDYGMFDVSIPWEAILGIQSQDNSVKQVWAISTIPSSRSTLLN